MSIRSSLGVIGGVVVFFVGLIAVGMQADIVRPTAMNSTSNGSQEAFNTTTSIFEGVGSVGGQGVALAGGAVFLILCIGLLVVAYGGAR